MGLVPYSSRGQKEAEMDEVECTERLYREDPRFRAIVDMLAHQFIEDSLRPAEILAAVPMARALAEARKVRQAQRTPLKVVVPNQRAVKKALDKALGKGE